MRRLLQRYFIIAKFIANALDIATVGYCKRAFSVSEPLEWNNLQVSVRKCSLHLLPNLNTNLKLINLGLHCIMTSNVENCALVDPKNKKR